MARRLIWTPVALDDLDEIAAWIARDSVITAERVVRRFLDRADRLTDQPGQGRRVPENESTDELREVFVHRWRMIYRVEKDRVVVVTLVHGARLIGRPFRPA